MSKAIFTSSVACSRRVNFSRLQQQLVKKIFEDTTSVLFFHPYSYPENIRKMKMVKLRLKTPLEGVQREANSNLMAFTSSYHKAEGRYGISQKLK
jgi:hypothetical protein